MQAATYATSWILCLFEEVYFSEIDLATRFSHCRTEPKAAAIAIGRPFRFRHDCTVKWSWNHRSLERVLASAPARNTHCRTRSCSYRLADIWRNLQHFMTSYTHHNIEKAKHSAPQPWKTWSTIRSAFKVYSATPVTITKSQMMYESSMKKFLCTTSRAWSHETLKNFALEFVGTFLLPKIKQSSSWI